MKRQSQCRIFRQNVSNESVTKTNLFGLEGFFLATKGRSLLDTGVRRTKKIALFSSGGSFSLRTNRRVKLGRGRICSLGGAFLFVVIAALAQPDVNPAGDPAATDESRPASVATPTSDAEANEAGQPLIPEAPGESPRTGVGTTMQPEPVAPAQESVAPAEEPVAPAGATAVADQAMIPPEPARKLWRISPIFSTGVLYDDNIFLTNTDRVADVIWTIPFGLSFELGDFRSNSENYVTAQWIGIPTFYTNNPNENALRPSGLLARPVSVDEARRAIPERFRNFQRG